MFLAQARSFLGRTFLGTLARNRAGNVLAITAAVIPPILVLVGGGIDMSRAYMTQTALQNACDAGVLAGRRAQAKSGAWGTAEQTKASNMFSFNFLGTASSAAASSTTFTPTDAGSGVISGTATTTMPTTVMKMFGTNSFTLTANCSAEFQLSNIDVMLVLDTTGSMACEPDGSDCDSDSDSKIEGLKTSIRSFYTTIAAAVPSGGTTRVRFAFVPYTGTVNLANFVPASGTPDIPYGHFASATNYQTRVGVFDRAIYTGTKTGSSSTTETLRNLSQDECFLYWYNKYPDATGQNPQQSGTAPSNISDTSYTPGTWTAGRRSTQSTCTRTKTTSTITGSSATRAYTLSKMVYKQDSVDTSTLRTRAATTIATTVLPNATVPTTGEYDMVQLGAMTGTTGITTSALTWSGCVEERGTVNSLISASSIPSGATDLDMVTAPSSDTNRWRVHEPALVFDRGQSANVESFLDYPNPTEYCPPAALKFTTVDTSNRTTVPTWIETYLGTLTAWGGTYHDLGMIWGARLAAPTGINSANVTAGNLPSVSRHIIFLTDGEMAPNDTLYSAYGLEYLDNRVAPSGSNDSTLATYHNGRYLAACQRARDMGYTVWVIGFGQALTTEMTTCASAGRSFYASDTATLQSTFRNIASQVADLRLKT